jgi:hypothetical protein
MSVGASVSKVGSKALHRDRCINIEGTPAQPGHCTRSFDMGLTITSKSSVFKETSNYIFTRMKI